MIQNMIYKTIMPLLYYQTFSLVILNQKHLYLAVQKISTLLTYVYEF